MKSIIHCHLIFEFFPQIDVEVAQGAVRPLLRPAGIFLPDLGRPLQRRVLRRDLRVRLEHGDVDEEAGEDDRSKKILRCRFGTR